ncbi:MAG: hypothetical protein AB1806_00115 [Acidobacteriota bacterium]
MPVRVLVTLLLASLAGAGGIPQAQARRPLRAMWLWNPSAARADPAARAALLDFARRERIGTIWAQVNTVAAAGPPYPPAARRDHVHASPRSLDEREGWKALIAAAHERGIRIEALDGDPAWALAANHHLALGVVDAVLAYNQQVSPAERFDGVHLDIEPYLLVAWRFPRSREALLREYLDVITHCQSHVHEFPTMAFGVDIPFWWQSVDGKTGRAIGEVRFLGTSKAASYHLIDRLDNVGIMNYRNKAAGQDGMINFGQDLLVYAEQARHAKIWMGVETSRSTPTPVWFVVGQPSGDVDRLLASDAAGLSPDGRFRGHRLRIIDDVAHTHVGLALPGSDPAAVPGEVREALVSLARRFSVLSAPGAPRGDEALDRALRALRANREWEDPTAVPLEVAGTGERFPGIIATNVMLPKLTFAGLPLDVMRREVAEAEGVFAGYSTYAGIAIHHFESYRNLVAGEAGDPPRLPWARGRAYLFNGMR